MRRKGESLKELLTSKDRMKKEKLTNCTIKVQSEREEKNQQNPGHATKNPKLSREKNK